MHCCSQRNIIIIVALGLTRAVSSGYLDDAEKGETEVPGFLHPQPIARPGFPCDQAPIVRITAAFTKETAAQRRYWAKKLVKHNGVYDSDPDALFKVATHHLPKELKAAGDSGGYFQKNQSYVTFGNF